MTRERATRRRCNDDRAKVSARDTQSIARNLDAEWRKGTLWAGIGMLAVWGPLLVLHAMGVF